jgi:ribosomal protein S12 methylthiotransferase
MSRKKISLNIVTLGCSKNVVDSEKFLGNLSKEKFFVTHNSEQPSDVVIVNTCGFIHDAREESVNTILSFAEARKSGLVKKLYITGCMAQRYKAELLNEIPEADGVVGFAEITALLNELNEQKNIPGNSRILATPKHYAYLKISEGCDRSCSFCAIPAIRGKHQSIPVESLLDETYELVSQGVKELLVIAQDTTYYGKDLGMKDGLALLLAKLSEIKELQWIRLHYTYPSGFPESVLEIIQSQKNICKYLDMPIQHVNDDLLKSMRRGHDKKYIIDLIEKIRKKIPEVYLRSSFIVGYPGEDNAKYNELLSFIKEFQIERMGVFGYSPEDGTPAFKLKSSVTARTIKSRIDKIMEVQQDVSLKINQQMIGKSVNVMIDGKEGDFYIGRSQYDSPEIDNEVIISSKKDLCIGNFYKVKIKDAEHFDLFATI